MPKLSNGERQRWKEYKRHRDEFWKRIEKKYHKQKKRHVECRLCGDMITTIEPDNNYEAWEKHERSHPEYAEWIALRSEFSIADLSKLLHDHDCVFVKCACICGCQSNICVADLPEDERNIPMLYELCELYEGRGHVEHRLPSE